MLRATGLFCFLALLSVVAHAESPRTEASSSKTLALDLQACQAAQTQVSKHVEALKAEIDRLKAENAGLREKLGHSEPVAKEPAPPTPTAQTDDFRGHRWGVSRAKARIKGEQIDAMGGIGIIDSAPCKVVQMPCKVMYLFVEDKLAFGKILLLPEHSNKNRYVDDFDSLVTALTRLYGPAEKNTYWSQDLYRDDPSNWGIALAVGHLSMFASWKTATTTIHAAVRGDNYEVTLAVDYTSNAHQPLLDKAREKAETQGL